MVRKILLLALPVIALSCGQSAEKKAMSDYEADVYERTLSRTKDLEKKLPEVSSYSLEQVDAFLAEVNELRYRNDTTGMTEAGKDACMKLESRIALLKRDADAVSAQRMLDFRVPVEVNDDCLLEKTSAYPVYLERGDVLYYNIGLQKGGTVKIYNTDARVTLNTYYQRANVSDSLIVENKGIYLVEVVPGSTQYASIDITYRMAGHRHLKKEVKEEEVECGAGDFRVVSNQGIAMRAAFDEPRKFTLSSQLKSAFSSAAKPRALVAVQIPYGSTELLYSLRISTSEQSKYTDGAFPDNMNASYKRVRFLGLPLYETSRSSGLFNTLLDDNRPIREEDAYCNMYVFRNQWTAKQFQDGTQPASQLQYDVDYSTIGTQSCSGRIPTYGARTIYLAFENERVRYSNYIWVEALTATPTTEYHTTKYTVD